jgi:hypothetical protein
MQGLTTWFRLEISVNQAFELPVLANPPNDIPQGLFVGQQSGSH